MFRIRLILEKGQERWVFRVGRVFRVVNVTVAAALVAAGWLLSAWVVPTILAALAVLGALYEESASFDLAHNRAEFRLGLVGLHRTRSFRLDQVAEVRLSQFGAARFTGLEVALSDGTVLTIENDRGKASHERLAGWARDLAGWLGVPLAGGT